MILHFSPSKHDKFKKPIAYTEEGVLAVIDSRSENASKVRVGEDWECKLVEDKDKFVIIAPLTRVKSEKENMELVKIKALELKQKWENR